jgi:Cys-rich protein (TIGR01571 family)
VLGVDSVPCTRENQELIYLYKRSYDQNQPMADWKSGICECCCDMTCCVAMVCPCVVLTWNAREMQAKGVSLSWLDTCLAPDTTMDKPLIGGVVYGLGEITGLHGISLCLHADLRHAIRKHQKIPACCCPCCCDGFCEDLFCVTSCSCCAFTQEKKELQNMVIIPERLRLVSSVVPELNVNTMLPPKPP